MSHRNWKHSIKIWYMLFQIEYISLINCYNQFLLPRLLPYWNFTTAISQFLLCLSHVWMMLNCISKTSHSTCLVGLKRSSRPFILNCIIMSLKLIHLASSRKLVTDSQRISIDHYLMVHIDPVVTFGHCVDALTCIQSL